MTKNAAAKEILDWILHITFAIIAGILIITYVAQRTVVDGNSMLPTLKDKDQLIIEKLTPRFSHIKGSDIVTIYIPEYLDRNKKYVVKRVIATEGDFVEIRQDGVFVNGQKLDENYILGEETLPVKEDYSSMTVPEGHIYVLGDNRMPNGSFDSRSFGTVGLDRVVGKMLVRVYPFK